MVCDVIGLVLQAVVVTGPSGGQDVVPDSPAVDLGLVQAARRDIQPRGRQSCVDDEITPQLHRRVVGGRVERPLRGDRGGRPVVEAQQPGLDPADGAPLTGFIIGGRPHPHPHPDPLARDQVRPDPGDQHAVDRIDPAGGRDGRPVNRHGLDLVGGLPPPRLRRAHRPGQPGSGQPDTQRDVVVLGARSGNDDRAQARRCVQSHQVLFRCARAAASGHGSSRDARGSDQHAALVTVSLKCQITFHKWCSKSNQLTALASDVISLPDHGIRPDPLTKLWYDDLVGNAVRTATRT